jgi:hypothetical protein
MTEQTTHPASKGLQASRDPLPSNQRRPVHPFPAMRTRGQHMLVRDVHHWHGDVVRLCELADVSVPSTSSGSEVFEASRSVVRCEERGE